MVGHTHVPGVFTDEPDFYPPTELGDDATFKLSASEKVLINVGSVGQPRDKDPRACYAVVSPGQVRFHRVPYDARTTSDKIRAIPELHDFLADRLLEGR
jgi:diadenosine tetraphosphatase ApaH/serine/threonine PP2A family protein phosphatase